MAPLIVVAPAGLDNKLSAEAGWSAATDVAPALLGGTFPLLVWKNATDNSI